jgi:uncharacterized membrane protein
MSVVLLKNKNFYIYLFIVVLFGAILRFININYSSLWADELYSMLSVYPGNSWYEILYMQRTYQPPAYFMLLWQWTKVFGYTEFSARLLSVLGGIFAIILSALLGRKIKDNWLGLLLAVIVAFNPTQIQYSLEARFYIFTYCVAVISLWLHWHLLINKPRNIILYLFLAGVNASLCYFHHFGLFFVFALFVHDFFVFLKEKHRQYFIQKIITYIVTALLYTPWFFWGLIKGMSTTQFWLKEIDVWKYFSFSMGYPAILTILFSVFILFIIKDLIKKENKYYSLFIFIVLFVIVLPLLYSFIRIPILVDRYGMVMAPVIYLIFGLSFISFIKIIRGTRIRFVIATAFIFLYSTPGVSLTFYQKSNLEKQPWREMAMWLKGQSDYQQTNIYTKGIFLKNRFTIDFYLLPSKKANHISNLIPGQDDKMYLVETSSVWTLDQNLLEKIYNLYDVSVVDFNKNNVDFGRIYICKKK